jgi:hypothetical protein
LFEQVVAITNEGKCRSKTAKVRTLKEEYEPERLPLYPGPVNANVSTSALNTNPKEKTEVVIERKKSLTKETKTLMPLRRRSKTFVNLFLIAI